MQFYVLSLHKFTRFVGAALCESTSKGEEKKWMVEPA